jgi:hypothetical protein
MVDLGKLQQALKAINYWGELTVRFQNGCIALIEKKETIKAQQYSRFVSDIVMELHR